MRNLTCMFDSAFSAVDGVRCRRDLPRRTGQRTAAHLDSARLNRKTIGMPPAQRLKAYGARIQPSCT